MNASNDQKHCSLFACGFDDFLFFVLAGGCLLFVFIRDGGGKELPGIEIGAVRLSVVGATASPTCELSWSASGTKGLEKQQLQNQWNWLTAKLD